MNFDGLALLFLLIAIGYFSIKIGFVPKEIADNLPSLLLNVCFPAMLFLNFAKMDRQQLLAEGLPTAVVTLTCSLIPFVIALFVFRKLPDSQRPTMRFISGTGNNSFVVIPLLSLFLTDGEMTIVFMHSAVMDFLIWGLHQQLFIGSSAGSGKAAVKKVLQTPTLYALILGVLFSVFSIKIPSFLEFSFEKLASAVSPLSLLYIGILLCSYGIFGWVKNKLAILYSISKVILLPCLTFAVLYWILPLKLAIHLSILVGAPCPMSAVLWCKQYGRDTKLAVDCFIPSTLLYFIVFGSLMVVLTGLRMFG